MSGPRLAPGLQRRPQRRLNRSRNDPDRALPRPLTRIRLSWSVDRNAKRSGILNSPSSPPGHEARRSADAYFYPLPLKTPLRRSSP